MSLLNILKITGRLMIPRLFCLKPFSLYSQYKVVLVCFEIDGNWLVPMLLLKKTQRYRLQKCKCFFKIIYRYISLLDSFPCVQICNSCYDSFKLDFSLLYCFNSVYTMITFKYRFQNWMWNIISTGSIPLYSGVFERKSNLN